MLSDVIQKLVKILAQEGDLLVVVNTTDKAYQLGTMLYIDKMVNVSNVSLTDGVLTRRNVKALVIG